VVSSTQVPELTPGVVTRKADATLMFTVTGATDREIQWGGRKGKLWRPDQIRVTYQVRDDKPGASITLVLYGVRVSGSVIKQDGTPGLIREHEWYQADQLGAVPAEAIRLAGIAMGVAQ
jgi:hypothetical protein